MEVLSPVEDLKIVSSVSTLVLNAVERRYNEPLHNEVLGITNDFLYPSLGVIVKHMKKNLDIKKLWYSEQILPVPWPFVISRFHCILVFKSSGFFRFHGIIYLLCSLNLRVCTN